MSKLQEQLAELAHDQWSGWMEYLFDKCIDYKPGKVQAEEGAVVIPKWAVERWVRQAGTKYCDLSSLEQDSDRAEADKFLAVFRTASKQLQAELAKAQEEIAFWMSEGDGTEWPPENMEWRKLFDIRDRTPKQTEEMVRLATVIRWKADGKIQYERAEQLQAELAELTKEMSYLLDCYQAAVLTKTCVEPWVKERATEIIKTEIAKGGEENKP